MLFYTGWLDAALVFFIAIFAFKYTSLKDKESKGLKWMIIGGLFLLVGTIFYLPNWLAVGLNLSGFDIVVPLIAFIIIVIGFIKLISELFE